MNHESQMWERNSFLTLTYDDKNLPKDKSINKRALQLFIKRLRKHLYNKVFDVIESKEELIKNLSLAEFTTYYENCIKAVRIRYYACGEYGDDKLYHFRNKYGGDLGRPHYHAIMFNYWPEDTEHYKNSEGYPIYKSESLNKLWKHGEVFVGTVTFDSAQYVAKYITKKITGQMEQERYQGKEPEFSIMSRKPGIGYSWLMKYYGETWRDDYVIVNEKKVKPPGAYKRKLKEFALENIDEFINYFKLMSKRLNEMEKKKYDDEYIEYQRNQDKEKFLKSVFKLFNRSTI